jgi:hypothetical protein
MLIFMEHTKTFLLPKSRQYPFDETMEQIVEALQKKKWKSGAAKTTLSSYGPDNKYTMVDTIKGSDFKVWFCREQGKIENSKYPDLAAVVQMNIPLKELAVFEDLSGPSLQTYVGKDWEKDRLWFETDAKTNAKLYNQPRRYLTYEGAFFPTKVEWHKNCGATWSGKLAPYMIHIDDSREYGLEAGDPESYNTAEVFSEFNDFFKVVLKRIDHL